MLFSKRADLDLVLVPTGMLFLVVYHIYLLCKIIKHPNSTVIGFENGNKRLWVQRMMQDIPKNTGIALNVISTNVSATSYLMSVSLTLISLMAAIVGSANTGSESKTLVAKIIYGDKSTETASIKYAVLLCFFLMAFMSQVQSMRYNVHVSFLISIANSTVTSQFVEDELIWASYFWSLGLRAYYFAFPLLLWIFGPIPMFACALMMVIFLYFFDLKYNPIPPFEKKLQEEFGFKLKGNEINISSEMDESSSRMHYTIDNPFAEYPQQ